MITNKINRMKMIQQDQVRSPGRAHYGADVTTKA